MHQVSLLLVTIYEFHFIIILAVYGYFCLCRAFMQCSKYENEINVHMLADVKQINNSLHLRDTFQRVGEECTKTTFLLHCALPTCR